MAYDYREIATRVMKLLEERPCRTQESIAKALTIDRHTMNRAVAEHFGKPFVKIQRDMVRARIEAHRAGRLVQMSELARSLKCSGHVLRHWFAILEISREQKSTRSKHRRIPKNRTKSPI